ncbi:hypothetical protein J2D73_17600 [Acetobacter sacchari]|uniref:DUF2268 domain-containing protein n=1 Tax=Acetobacter sacchari TaxID=2661687 RepID=A0ABS3M0A5_9PROT|nr:DUF2268 domain-containing putative Zn-dependent protease [Acetobacter sacchari]MBO1361603.1 hypothetical protein [Acetobacter sacchari]
MKNWTVHWLGASGNLDDYHTIMMDALQSAYTALSHHVQIPEIDVLIQRAVGHTIPELGISGRAYRASLFALSFDPDNPNLANSLLNGALARQIVHEVHHCLRMAGQGYGKTFGEALVSEGLAGRFVQHVLQSQPEPWEAAVPISILQAFMVKKSALSDARYDHARWFFGRGLIPRWFGYTLGYEIVGEWLNTTCADTVDWINVAADVPITAAIKSGLISTD